MPAQITFSQVTKPPGVAGKAREDFEVGLVVTCINSTVESSYSWTLLDVPLRSALLRGSVSTGDSLLFTPDVKGTYLVSLQVNGSVFPSDNAVSFCAVLTAGDNTLSWRYLAAGEEGNADNVDRPGLGFPGDTNMRGWATPRDLQLEQTEIAAEGVINAVVSSPGAGANNLVRLNPATGKFDSSVVPSSGGGLVSTPVQTGSYTASVGDRVLYDPSAGTTVITAPSPAAPGDLWAIKNVTTDVTPATVDGGGVSIEDPLSPAFVPSYAVNTLLIAVNYLFDGTNWVII